MLSLVIVKLKSIINCNNINWLQANLSKQRRNRRKSRNFAHFKRSTASFACRKACVQACWWPWRSGSKMCQIGSISPGNGMKSSRRGTITSNFCSKTRRRETSRNQPEPASGAQNRLGRASARTRSIGWLADLEAAGARAGGTGAAREASTRGKV